MQTNPAAAARLIAEALAAHGGEATEQSEVDSPEHADKGDATGLNPAGTEAHPSAKDPTQDAAATDAG